MSKKIIISWGQIFQSNPTIPPIVGGSRDKIQINLRVGEKKNSEVKLNLWREGNTVLCEHSKYNNYKSRAELKSETQDVVMELPPCVGPVTLIATREAKEAWSWGQKEYTLTLKEHGGRPVYPPVFGSSEYSLYILTMEDGRWAVSQTEKGHSEPLMRSIKAAPCPSLCEGWEYREPYKSEFKPGDISVKCVIHNQS